MDAVQIEAQEIKPGDHVECEDGSFVRIAAIRDAKWIKTGDGKTCLELLATRHAPSGFIIGRTDLVKVRRKASGHV